MFPMTVSSSDQRHNHKWLCSREQAWISSLSIDLIFYVSSYTRAPSHTHTHAHTRTRTHARTHPHAHTHTYTHTRSWFSPNIGIFVRMNMTGGGGGVRLMVKMIPAGNRVFVALAWLWVTELFIWSYFSRFQWWQMKYFHLTSDPYH